jgi:uncharacterized membrane protein (DUF2068 family)
VGCVNSIALQIAWFRGPTEFAHPTRCLRCDSWLPLPAPEHPSRRYMPAREQIQLPLRGKPLRDKIILRLIAVDRAIHFLVLLALAVFLIAAHEQELRQRFYRLLADIQGGVGGGPLESTHTGLVGDLDRLFSLDRGTLHLVGAGLIGYALLEGAEAVGLWFQRRWAEYLTFVATTLLVPLEVYELTVRVSWFKLAALIVNVAIVLYLLLAKRLFGLRGGGALERAEREHDIGWPALERGTPVTRDAADRLRPERPPAPPAGREVIGPGGVEPQNPPMGPGGRRAGPGVQPRPSCASGRLGSP